MTSSPAIATRSTRPDRPDVVYVTARGSTARCFLQEHFLALQKAGYRVALACSDDEDAHRVAADTGVTFYPVAIPQSISPLRDLAATWKLYRLFRRLRPTVVHSHMAKAGLVASLAAKLAGVPLRIYHNHGLAVLEARGLKRALLYGAEWTANRCATHVLFCGQSTLQTSCEMGLSLPSRSAVLGKGTISGVDTARLSPERAAQLRPMARKRWELDDRFVVGFAGRFVPQKGLDTLLEAWQLCQPQLGQPAMLLLAGSEDDPAIVALVERAQQRGLPIRRAGWVSDMAEFYAAIDVLALPSWYEGFPYSLLEAQSSGVSVVASDATGNVDAVTDRQTGLLVSRRSPKLLSGALLELARDRALRERLGCAARVQVERDFRQETVMKNLVEFYDRLMQSCKPGSTPRERGPRPS